MLGALCYCQRHHRCNMSVRDATKREEGLLRDMLGASFQAKACQMLLSKLQCTTCNWVGAVVLE